MNTLPSPGLFLLCVSVGGINGFRARFAQDTEYRKVYSGAGIEGVSAPRSIGLYVDFGGDVVSAPYSTGYGTGPFAMASALIAAGNMFAAAFVSRMVMSGDPFSKRAKAFFYMIVFLFIAIAGSGVWTVGRLFRGWQGGNYAHCVTV